jgi:hypothetical protein
MHGFSMANGMPNVANKFDVSSVDIIGNLMSDFNSNFIHDGTLSCDVGLLEPNLVGSMEQTKEGSTDEVVSTTMEGLTNLGLQDSMGIASSPKTNGKSPVFSWVSPNNAKNTFFFISDGMFLCKYVSSTFYGGGYCFRGYSKALVGSED